MRLEVWPSALRIVVDQTRLGTPEELQVYLSQQPLGYTPSAWRIEKREWANGGEPEVWVAIKDESELGETWVGFLTMVRRMDATLVLGDREMWRQLKFCVMELELSRSETKIQLAQRIRELEEKTRNMHAQMTELERLDAEGMPDEFDVPRVEDREDEDEEPRDYNRQPWKWAGAKRQKLDSDVV
jgi:hypothetical protein